MYHGDVQRFTASNRLILTVFAGKYVSLLGEPNKLRRRSSLKALPRVSLSRELTRGLHISWVSESITMSSQINKGTAMSDLCCMFSLHAVRVMHSFSLEN